MARVYNVPNPLPILPLPANQILYPSQVLTLQIARPSSISLVQSVLREAEQRPGNKALIIGCAPFNVFASNPASSDEGSGAKEGDNQKGGRMVKHLPRDHSAQGENGSGAPSSEDLFDYATAARIIRLERTTASTTPGVPVGGYLIVVEGLSRIHLDSFSQSTPFLEAMITVHPNTSLPDHAIPTLIPQLEAATSAFLTTLSTSSGVQLPPLLVRRIKAILSGLNAATAAPLLDILIASVPTSPASPSALTTTTTTNSPIATTSANQLLPFSDKLAILASVDPFSRIELGLELITRLNESLKMRKRIGDKVEENVSRRQREYWLLQQLAAIRQELEDLAGSKEGGNGGSGLGGSGFLGSGGVRQGGGTGGRKVGSGGEEEEEEEEDDIAEIERKIKEKKGWSDEARKVAMRELKRLKKSPPQGAEHGVIRNYLDWLIALPWNESTPLPLSRDFIHAARQKLDQDHYGLEKIKKRLLEWLAVLRLKQEQWEHDLQEERNQQAQLAIATPSDNGEPSDSSPPPSRSSSSESSSPLSSSKAVALRDPNLPSLISPSSELPPPALPSHSPNPPPHPKKASNGPQKPRDKGPILLLHGPPGTGKTSIAKSLAEAMGRKFYRISLGGVRDEAEIRGHRRTYVAALPGALAQALRKTGVNNPVILLDEIDKLGMSSTHGDPAAALLEVLDPEQNWSFQDHYLGIPMDLSQILFIATANTLDTISDPLYDRMEVIELSGYVHDEKLAIARKYLIPKQLKANMLPPDLLSMSDDVLFHLITSYTHEAGVRSLERELAAVCRAKAVEYAEARDKAREAGELGDELDVQKYGYEPVVTKEDVIRILGREKHEAEELDRESMVGIATGLGYRGSGNGGILHIESTTMPGGGRFRLTGQLGEVISESAQLAFAWVKSHSYHLGISSSPTLDAFSAIDIHVHLPSGSIKKDGPSAGVAMVVAIVSLMRGLPVRRGVAMTGEITLRGMVTPVGGIKEKVLAAHRAGIRTLILPFKNAKDVMQDLPKSALEDLHFIYVRNIWEALEGAFGERLWMNAEGETLRHRGGEQLAMESRL